MKKGFYLLILLTLCMPFYVDAATASFSLNCSSTEKIGGTVNCSIVGEITPELDETLKEFSATVKVDEENVFATGTPINETELSLTGTSQTIKTFTLAVKKTASIGNTDIVVEEITAKDNSGTGLNDSNTYVFIPFAFKQSAVASANSGDIFLES